MRRHTYIHTYIVHTYIHTYIRTYIHTYTLRSRRWSVSDITCRLVRQSSNPRTVWPWRWRNYTPTKRLWLAVNTVSHFETVKSLLLQLNPSYRTSLTHSSTFRHKNNVNLFTCSACKAPDRHGDYILYGAPSVRVTFLATRVLRCIPRVKGAGIAQLV